MRVLITGGAGFVGSSLATSIKADWPDATVVALDNLKRRGSELNLPILRHHGVEFVHGDIRSPADLDDLPGSFDVLIEASAEPSVLAGLVGSPNYLIQTNLTGTLNCLEFARKRARTVIFLSTSRVYSIEPLRSIAFKEGSTRFEVAPAQPQAGISVAGVSEFIATQLPRSLYGATKLASELLIQEYCFNYGLNAVINRCGVIAGPGQFGKVDQGVFTLWVANHFFGKPLKYTGFGGGGKQVRDLLHPRDLYALVKKQILAASGAAKLMGEIYNVGGGVDVSTSLLELTALCREVVGREVPVGRDETTTLVDIPLYVSDCRKVSRAFEWAPKAGVKTIVEEIAAWLSKNETQLAPLFAAQPMQAKGAR